MRALALALLLVIAAPRAGQATTWKAYHRDHAIRVYSVRWEDQRSRELWARLLRTKIARSFHHWKDLRAAELATVTSVPVGSSPPVAYTGDHEALWLCIHSMEGAWTDPGAPYFGGLQMGYGFMEAYGGSLYAEKGTADHWTPDEQIGVAEGAWAANGFLTGWLFSQWPVSGPACM
jgi:hypothetical protein